MLCDEAIDFCTLHTADNTRGNIAVVTPATVVTSVLECEPVVGRGGWG